ncbi:MAG TPA: septum formation initiator family protein, partial [Candidatus Sulfotelmatobacter sp.]
FFSTTNFPGRDERARIFAEKAPQAELFAASWIERVRPLGTQVYGLRRRIATLIIAAAAILFLVHVMLGANGMVAYKQKRNDYQALKKQIAHTREENEKIAQQIQGLQSDKKAIEKEAREQLGYAKPGEYVYVAPPPAKPEPLGNHSARR